MSGIVVSPPYDRSGGPSPKSAKRSRDFVQRRIRFGFLILLVGYLVLAGRLVYIQVIRHRHYWLEASHIRQHTIPLPAQRGDIYDRNGLPLAVNVTVGDVIADPTAIADPAATSAALAQILPGVNVIATQQAIVAAQQKKTAKGKPVRFAVLQTAIDYDRVEAFQTQLRAEQKAHYKKKSVPVDLAGLSITTRQVRTYPNLDLAAQVVGFDSHGAAGDVSAARISGRYGVERSQNALLAGRDGSTTAEFDAQGRMIPGTQTSRISPTVGRDITLTIDNTIQRIAQEELEKSWATHHAQLGTVVVLDPADGDILALANLPTFDPNTAGKKGESNLQWHNAAVTDLYEPGSTMKTLTLAAVMDAEGVQHMYDHVHCSGTLQVGNHIIHCAKDPPLYGVHGDETMREVLQNSCNIGAAEYALRLGPDKLFEYEKRFGLLDKPDSGMPGEQYSHLKGPDEKPWSKIQLANIAFGQGISMTPLQVASIYATIANNGVRVHPHIIMGQGYKGPLERAVKPEVAKAMMSMLQTVVIKGTGKPAQIAGYNVGGKTGSAQVAEHGHYGDEYVGSFCGIAPLSHPRLVILCSIFKPVGVHWGAVVAAPVVHNIAKRALWYLKEPRDNPSMTDYQDAHPAANSSTVKSAAAVKHPKVKKAA